MAAVAALSRGARAAGADGLLRRPRVPQECGHNAHIYYLLLPDLERRTAFIGRLKERGILSVFHYVPLHSSPCGLRCSRADGDLAGTLELSDRLVRLPLWLGLEDAQDDVIRQIHEVLAA
jgi:dTDP-4-amino-4,6-dideoxygalactose transaminase